MFIDVWGFILSYSRDVNVLFMFPFLFFERQQYHILRGMSCVSNCYSTLENTIIKRRDRFLSLFVHVIWAFYWCFFCCFFLDNNITYLETYQATIIIIRRFRMLLSNNETCSILRYKGSVIYFLSWDIYVFLRPRQQTCITMLLCCQNHTRR